MPASGNPEAFSRVLIDRALTESGWDLLDPHQVRFELDGIEVPSSPYTTASRRPAIPCFLP